MGRFGNIPPVVKNLLIINVLLLIFTRFLYSSANIYLIQYLGLFYPGSNFFMPHQFVTYMFMHGGWAHIFFNMFALWMFGKVLEGVWGSRRFLVFYLVTGIGAALVHLLVTHIEITVLINDAQAFMNTPSFEAFEAFINKHVSMPDAALENFINRWGYDPNNESYIPGAVDKIRGIINNRRNIPTVGASGAVFGVLLAFGMLFPNTQLMLIFPPIPIKAKYFVIGYGVLELIYGVTSTNDGIAHFAHLGGMLFGYFLIKYWNRKSSNFY